MTPCANCTYDLTGLPDAHVCPECALHYDPHMRVWSTSQQRERRDLYYGVGLCAMWLYVTFRHPALRGRDAYGVGALVFFLTLASAYSLSRIRGGMRLLSVNHAGVSCAAADGRCVCLPWQSIARAECRWFSGRIVLRGHQGETVASWPALRLGSTRIARQFVEHVNVMRSMYTSRYWMSVKETDAWMRSDAAGARRKRGER